MWCNEDGLKLVDHAGIQQKGHHHFLNSLLRQNLGAVTCQNRNINPAVACESDTIGRHFIYWKKYLYRHTVPQTTSNLHQEKRGKERMRASIAHMLDENDAGS